MAIADRKAMVIAPESSDSQESNIYKLVSFWDIIFFCNFSWLTIFEFVRAISWSPAFSDMKIVVIALCHLLREAFIRKRGEEANQRTKGADKLQSAHNVPKIQPYL